MIAKGRAKPAMDGECKRCPLLKRCHVLCREAAERIGVRHYGPAGPHSFAITSLRAAGGFDMRPTTVELPTPPPPPETTMRQVVPGPSKAELDRLWSEAKNNPRGWPAPVMPSRGPLRKGSLVARLMGRNS